MRTRRIAILIDGGFFLKRISKLVPEDRYSTAEATAKCITQVCFEHVIRLTQSTTKKEKDKWLDHVYRLFYYDAKPYEEMGQNPISQEQIKFGQTPEARFRLELFNLLRKKRKFALRLGKVASDSNKWSLRNYGKLKKLLQTRDFALTLQALADGSDLPALDQNQKSQLSNLAALWGQVDSQDVTPNFTQKGVDMRIGVDITTLTLKKQVDTIILITGDSDFVPAAKVARREGVEFLLDPLWQSINDDLNEHIDGLVSGLPKPNTPQNPT